MIKYFALTAVLFALPATLVGCGGGMSTEDAQAECEALRQRLASCLEDEDTIAACVSCYEDCGVNCNVSNDCPATFSCGD